MISNTRREFASPINRMSCALPLFTLAIIAGCSSTVAPTPIHTATQSKVPWTDYERGPIAVSMPGVIYADSTDDMTGATSLVTKTADDLILVSLCVMPATSVNLVNEDIRRGEINSPWVVDSFQQIFKVVRDQKLVFRSLNTRPASVGFDKAINLETGVADGRIVRLPQSYAVAYILTLAPTDEIAALVADRVRKSIEERLSPPFPPNRRATGLDAAVPDDWILIVDDVKKRYWASPDRNAFFMLSYPFPAPGATMLPQYGMDADMARLAITTAETLSGRNASVSESVLRFDRRLWILMSRARGSVEQKAGIFQVEMDRWIDPRTSSFHRVYVGGLTDADLDKARKIRDTLTFNWK